MTITTMAAAATTTASLPTPTERPEADVVIYDGQCQFCQRQVARLAGFDRGGRLAFLSLHDERVGHDYPDLSHDALMEEIHVVDRRGRRFRGAGALRYLSRRIPRLWPLAPWLHLPGTLWFWQWCYRHVARRRYALAGKTACDGGTCHLHANR